MWDSIKSELKLDFAEVLRQLGMPKWMVRKALGMTSYEMFKDMKGYIK